MPRMRMPTSTRSTAKTTFSLRALIRFAIRKPRGAPTKQPATSTRMMPPSRAFSVWATSARVPAMVDAATKAREMGIDSFSRRPYP